MADRDNTSPVPHIAEVPSRMFQSALQWERVAMKWRNLAAQRRDHHFELYRSGRWKHYYTDEQFLDEMRKAVDLAERWEGIAPLPDERKSRAKAAPAGKTQRSG